MTTGNQDFGQRKHQSAQRVGDAATSLRHGRAHRRQGGLSLIEMLVTLALVSVSLGIAIPRAPRGAFAMWRAHAQLIADLRHTRADSLTRGDHFLFEVTGANTYSEHRMTWNGVAWVKDVEPTRSRTLPDGVTFSAGSGATFEFNTRGLLVLPDAAESLRLYQADSGIERQITVWPSGQVAPL